MVVAKSIAGGLPLSGVLGRAEIMDAPGDSAIGGTYVGNPVAQAAALAVLDVIEEEGLVARASVDRRRDAGAHARLAGALPAGGRRPRPRRDARHRARPGSRDEGAGPRARDRGRGAGDGARPAAAQGGAPRATASACSSRSSSRTRSSTRRSTCGKGRSRQPPAVCPCGSEDETQGRSAAQGPALRGLLDRRATPDRRDRRRARASAKGRSSRGRAAPAARCSSCSRDGEGGAERRADQHARAGRLPRARERSCSGSLGTRRSRATSPLRALVISDGNFKQLLGEDRHLDKVHETLAARTPPDESD